MKTNLKALVLAGVIAMVSTAAFAQSYNQDSVKPPSATYLQWQSNSFSGAPGPYDDTASYRSPG